MDTRVHVELSRDTVVNSVPVVPLQNSVSHGTRGANMRYTNDTREPEEPRKYILLWH